MADDEIIEGLVPPNLIYRPELKEGELEKIQELRKCVNSPIRHLAVPSPTPLNESIYFVSIIHFILF